MFQNQPWKELVTTLKNTSGKNNCFEASEARISCWTKKLKSRNNFVARKTVVIDFVCKVQSLFEENVLPQSLVNSRDTVKYHRKLDLQFKAMSAYLQENMFLKVYYRSVVFNEEAMKLMNSVICTAATFYEQFCNKAYILR